MFVKFKNLFNPHLLKVLVLLPFLFTTLYPSKSNHLEAGLEFQWDNNSDYKRLKWYQRDNLRRARNTIFLFLRPSDRKTGLLKINLKVPEKFTSSVNEKKISICQVKIGGFDSRTKCIKEISSDVEVNEDKTSIDIYPITPIPSNRDSYAVVFKVINPNKTGLYQFHSFGQASGKIPVSNYLGSWTIMID